MTIAIICPIGDLNRFGYQRVAPICLESWRSVGDLFLIHSSRSTMPFDIEATYIRDDSTLMQLRDSAEWFDHRLVAANANRGLQAAREASYDCAITICVNWYVEAEAARAIEQVCGCMLNEQRNYDYLYRRVQIFNTLFDADLCTPALINIRQVASDVVKVLVDTLEIDGETIEMRRGNYLLKNPEAYIDCGLEVTLGEWMEKMQDIRNYEDILPKRHGADLAYWYRYFDDRRTWMNVSNDALGSIGLQVQAARPDRAFGDRWL